MQREHAKVYFQPLLEKKSLLNISNLIIKSTAKSRKPDLVIQKKLIKSTIKTEFSTLYGMKKDQIKYHKI